MKNLKILKYSLCLSLLFIFFNCSKDDSYQLNKSIILESTEKNGETSSDSNDIILIRIVYDFESTMTTAEKDRIKRNHYISMSSHFTIYAIETNASCDNIEYWEVNGREYHEYINSVKADRGTSDIDEEDGDMQEVPDDHHRTGDCNNMGTPRYRRY